MSQIAPALRATVIDRARRCCEYCQVPDLCQIGFFEVDHVEPTSRGGLTTLENLAYACPHCNDHKWAHNDGTDPDTGTTTRLFHPRKDQWDEHFIHPEGAPFEIRGKTAIGRATVERLKLNHPGVVGVRRELALRRVYAKPR